jgi:hypothetical protein
MKSTLSIFSLIMHALLAVACLTLFCPDAGKAETVKLSENEVKASYLYNFAKYVEWPAAVFPRENSPLTICIVGKSPMNEVIESLAGKSIKNRRLVIRQFSRIEDLSDCNILFINATVKTSILTVSDQNGFAAAGGMIEYVPVGSKIRFKINNRAAKQVNLQISSHLLRLSTTAME